MPGVLELAGDAMRQRAGLPIQALRRMRDLSASELRRRARALGELVRFGLASASPTPLNGDLSPHRRFE